MGDGWSGCSQMSGNKEADRPAIAVASEGSEPYILPDFSEVVNYKGELHFRWKEDFDKRSREKEIWF